MSGTSRQVVDGEHAGPQPIVDVVGVIGDVVRDRAGLGLRTRELGECEVLAGAVFGDLLGNRALLRYLQPSGRGTPAASVKGPLCLTRPSRVSQVRLRPSKPA